MRAMAARGGGKERVQRTLRVLSQMSLLYTYRYPSLALCEVRVQTHTCAIMHSNHKRNKLQTMLKRITSKQQALMHYQ